MDQAFQDHIASGLTTLCRCWAITRTDGVAYGFTDHDCDLFFEGLTFRANTGLSASALQQASGLSVDNTEAIGALTDTAVSEADIDAGRFDGADLRAWMVNWAAPDTRWLMFRGSIGELRRGGGAFHAELRGLTDALNRPVGRVYQKPCTAVLGDGNCRFAMQTEGYRAEVAVAEVEAGRVYRWPELAGFEPGWFTGGRLVVRSGAASGLWQTIKQDRFVNGTRQVTLWEPVRAEVAPGDQVRLEAGCDKRMETCRLKFNNLLNFQGFPDIPGEDWMLTVPKQDKPNTGGSRR
ncbi:MAG: DUF2163 domain-containing protein [Marinibacterium sp.]|nr:DUF2163 domain-containing protein [Marinibacterium sp.]